MRILAIETATPTASVALLDGPDPAVVGEITAHVPQRHLEWLVPAIAELLERAGWRPQDVQAVAVSLGPGSFTGLRIGIATAAAWAHARNLPIAGVSTLEVLATAVAETLPAIGPSPHASGLICPVLDVRKGEVAVALFEWRPLKVQVMRDTIALAATLLERLPRDRTITFTGDGVPRILDALRTRPKTVIAPESEWHPRAAFVGAVALGRLAHGDRDDPYLLRPVYARGAGVTLSPRSHGPEAGEGNPGGAEEE